MAATTIIDTMKQKTPPAASPLSLYFEASQFTSSEIAEIIHLLSDIYRSVGGDGLVIKNIDLLDFSPVGQP